MYTIFRKRGVFMNGKEIVKESILSKVDLEMVSGGVFFDSCVKYIFKNLGPIKFENRKCTCALCGEEFCECYPVNPPPGFCYMYWGKGLYCHKCWHKAKQERFKK